MRPQAQVGSQLCGQADSWPVAFASQQPKPERIPMAYYLFQAAYTPEALATLIKKPENRIEVVAKAIEKLGGRVIGGWFSFGEYDVVLVSELPDSVSAAAFAVAAAAGGALKSNKTTLLLSPEETVQMFSRAGKTGYRPPK